MHLALCTQQFGNYWSGLGLYSTLLARGLVKKGIRLTIISPGDPIPEIDANFVHVKPSAIDPTHGGWFSLARAYRRELKKIKPDIVHFTDARESFGYKGNIPAIGTLHDDYFARHSWIPWYYKQDYADWVKRYAYYSFVTLAERIALRNLKALIANSECTASTVCDRYSIDSAKVRTIYIQPDLHVDEQREMGETETKGDMTLLFVGGNIQRKGLPKLLQALQLLKARFPPIQLRILGKNQNLAKMEILARKMDLSDRVHFEGWVHPSKMEQYYRQAQVFVMPSLMEGYGLVYLEAMSHGLPVVAGDVGGTRELIQQGQNGLLVNSLNVDELAKSIGDLLTDQSLRKKVISGGYETVRNLNTEAMIDQTYQYYSATIERNS